MNGEGPVRIAMWSGRGNISTAMMRAWENREDTWVWDEPLYAYYLQATGLDHPGAEEVIAAGETDWRVVVERLLGPIPDGRRVMFQKHMTHHLLDAIDRGWLDEVVNCFLIRNPREVIASYARTRPEVTLADVGIEQEAEIHAYLSERLTRPPVVLDARDVLENPRGLLERLCDVAGVAFSERMLAWPPGPRANDGVWAKYWYHSVHDSSGFAPYVPKGADLPPHLEPLAAACEPFYRMLHDRRLMP